MKTKKVKRVQYQSRKKKSKKYNKKGGANMNDVDIDEVGDVRDALDIKEEFYTRGIFDSLKVGEGNLDDKRSEMPELKCTIL